jgi:hypothetical protein
MGEDRAPVPPSMLMCGDLAVQHPTALDQQLIAELDRSATNALTAGPGAQNNGKNERRVSYTPRDPVSESECTEKLSSSTCVFAFPPPPHDPSQHHTRPQIRNHG